MKKTTVIFILALIGISNLAYSQSLNCLWAQNEGGTGVEESVSVSTDASGNVFITGYFSSPSIAFGTFTLTNAGPVGSVDVFIVKFSSLGNVLWAKSVGGISNDVGISVATDANGNVFLTGYFQSPNIVFGTTILTNSNNTGTTSDIFVVKYSPSGTVLWASSAGGNSFDIGYGISTDTNGNVFLTGCFQSNAISFGTITLTNVSIGNSEDIFIVKYSPTGSVLWAKSSGGSSYDSGSRTSTDTNGNVFMTGYFTSPAITFGTFNLTNIGTDAIFIVKYSPTGTVLWAKSVGSNNQIGYNVGVSTDLNGNVFMTGPFSSPAISFGNFTLAIPNGVGFISDIFIVKYSPIGTELWAHSAGGTNYSDRGNSASTDAIGNVIVTGTFASPTITFGTFTLTNAGPIGTNDVFIVKYSPTGSVLWAQSLGGNSDDRGYSVSSDANGNELMTGCFKSPSIAFGAITLTNADNTGNTSDIYVAKLSDPIVGINESQVDAGIAIYPNPFSSQTTISFSEVQTNTTIKIIDLLGNEIRRIPVFHEQQIVIDRGALDLGIYFVQIIDENNMLMNKKIVLR